VGNLNEYINSGVEQISFADGTSWSRADLRVKLLTLASTAGDDSITGYNTADTLTGGAGADTLAGGSGADVFHYLSAGDSPAGARDIIVDFANNSDKIDLSALDANTATPADDLFSFIGAGAFNHVAGELRADTSISGKTVIEGDLDGDGLPDFQVELTGTYNLSASTFVL
jgi:Ca2+-binding RTX toxin-like protein